jgi:hypothetical protein
MLARVQPTIAIALVEGSNWNWELKVDDHGLFRWYLDGSVETNLRAVHCVSLSVAILGPISSSRDEIASPTARGLSHRKSTAARSVSGNCPACSNTAVVVKTTQPMSSIAITLAAWSSLESAALTFVRGGVFEIDHDFD